MRKLAFIPTREELPNPKLAEFFQKAGWEPIFLPGYSSIFEAFSSGRDLHNVKPNDMVILCHDDIDIVVSPKYFNEIIDNSMDMNTGFLGVAGTRFLGTDAVWWKQMGQHDARSPMNPLSGMIMHGSRKENHTNFYGSHGSVVVMDGVFLCARGKTINTISLKKPKSFKGNWDFYDIYYTYQAHKKGFINKTIPIVMIHESTGEISERESWHQNRKAFMESAELPVMIK
jgi:hypothetical protein